MVTGTMTEPEALAAWIVARVRRDEDRKRQREVVEELRRLAALYRSHDGYGEWYA